MKTDVLIIGGGVAGLSAGIYGQLNGYTTEILEMHSQPGGQCTAWKRKGYTFDYCIHWLVGSSHGAFHDIWKETGALNGQTRIVDPDTYVTMRMPDGEDFIIYSDINRWEQYLVELAPEDRIPGRWIHAIYQAYGRKICISWRQIFREEQGGKDHYHWG